MDASDTRPISDHEFATTVARATARLHGSVQRLDGGDDLALDDLANVLRLMICVGDGNRLLLRGLERARPKGGRHPEIALPAVTSQAGNHWGMLPFLSGGNLPADDGDPPSSLQRFVNTTCLRAIDDDTEAVFDWNGLVRVVAEKLGGVHADDETPVLIDELKTYQIAEIPLIHYMLRACALVVVQAGVGVADVLGAAVSLETLPLTTPPGRWIGSFAIAGGVEGNLDVRVQIRGGDPPGTLVGRQQVPIPKPLMDPEASGPGATIRRRVEPVGRNDLCPCGSGRKYKRCHGERI